MFSINLGMKELYNDRYVEMSPEHPHWNVYIHIPIIGVKLGSPSRYDESITSFQTSFNTCLILMFIDKGSFWSIDMRILGFGLGLTRQSDY